MKVGLCTIALREWDIFRVIELAAELGYDGIEIWGKPPHIPQPPTRKHARRIAAACCQNDIEPAVYGSYLRLGAPDFLSHAETELVVARALGVPLIRVWAGSQEWQQHDAGHFCRVVADLEKLSEMAGVGLTIVVERHSGTLTNTREGARRVIEAAGRPNCRLNWQLEDFKQSPSEILADITALAPLVGQAHLQAVAKPGDGVRSLLRDSYPPWREIISILKASGFHGWLNVEFLASAAPPDQAARADLEFVRSLL